MDNIIATIEAESVVKGKVLSIGKAVSDVVKKENYSIKSLNEEGILLEHKPYFKQEPKRDLFIAYEELVDAYIGKRIDIEGFPNSESPLDLKRAILDVIQKIRFEQKEKQIEYVNKALIQKEKEASDLLEKSQKLEYRGRGKKAVKGIRKQVEWERNLEKERIRQQEEEAERKRQQEEQDRINEELRLAEEKRAAREKELSIASMKNKSQQQRLRLLNKFAD